jgi:hypothetical protein
MKNLFVKLDFIGPVPTLYYNKEVRYKTVFGGLSTLLTGILSILAFIGFGYNLLARQNPVSIYSKEANEGKLINYNETFLLFAPHLPYGGRLNEEFNRKFKMTFRYVNSDGISPDRRNNMTYIIDQKMIPCSENTKFQQNLFNVSQQLLMPVEDYYCTPNDFTIPLTNTFGTARFGIYIIMME